jgi:hypothetical protein
MAKKPKKMWVYSPPKPKAPTVPQHFKDEVKAKADHWVETALKPKHIKPPPANPQFNYLIDISTKWHRHYFYVQGEYRCPSPHAILPTFEAKFARLECVQLDRFNLSYMRHTEQWFEVFQNLSLQECMEQIEDNPIFIIP